VVSGQNCCTSQGQCFISAGNSRFTPGLRSLKRHANRNSTSWIQNSHLEQCISWGWGDWQRHPIWCMTTPLVDIRTCRVCMLCVCIIYTFLCTVYIHFYTIYLFLMQYKYKRLTSRVFGTVHSTRTVVVLRHKHFSSWLRIFFNSVSIITNFMYDTMTESNITACINNSFTFLTSHYYV
jgi:hypothetical protein